MTDRCLVSESTRIRAWVPAVYRNTSGYIHLSEKHFFSAMATSGDEGHFTCKISDEDANARTEACLEAIGA